MNPPRDGRAQYDPREATRETDNLRIDIENLNRLVAKLLEKNGDFTKEERDAIRKNLKRDERIAWFWGSVRLWAGWIAGIAAFFVLIQEYISGVLKAIFR